MHAVTCNQEPERTSPKSSANREPQPGHRSLLFPSLHSRPKICSSDQARDAESLHVRKVSGKHSPRHAVGHARRLRRGEHLAAVSLPLEVQLRPLSLPLASTTRRNGVVGCRNCQRQTHRPSNLILTPRPRWDFGTRRLGSPIP